MISFENPSWALPEEILVLAALFYEMDKDPNTSYLSRAELLELLKGKTIGEPDHLIESLYGIETSYITYTEATEGNKDHHHTERYYTLTIEGLKWLLVNANEAIEIANSAQWNFPEGLIAKLWSQRINTAAGEHEIPASDRYVEIDHNSAEFHELSSTLDEIEEQIRGNNELNEKAPNAKDEALSGLRAVRELLTPNRIALGVVSFFILPTLYKIADKLSDYVSDAAIHSAISLTKAIFGI